MPSSNFLLSKFQSLGKKINKVSQGATELNELHGDFFKFFFMEKLRLNSACSASHCKSFTQLYS